MANSKLETRSFVFPTKILPEVYNLAGGEQGVSEQLKKYISRGSLTYYEMKNFLRDFKNMGDDEKNVNGGRPFYSWVFGTLNHARNVVANHKDNMSAAGFSNTHIKPHEKENNMPKSTKTLRITEEQYRKIFIIKN